MSRLVTLAMAVYGQPLMLEVWFETLRTYPDETLNQIELLIVDDCGTPPATIPEDIQGKIPCQIFRVTEDIPWNQPGARNLALEECRTPLILFVDPDMVFPSAMMERMLAAGAKISMGEVIRFQLKHRKNSVLDGSSPNTWFLHVEDFLRVGAYDEDFSGHKGWSDVQLLDVIKNVYKVSHRADLFADFYSSDEIEDAMVTKIDRNTSYNRKVRLRRVAQARKEGGWAKWAMIPKKRLRFKWTKVL